MATKTSSAKSAAARTSVHGTLSRDREEVPVAEIKYHEGPLMLPEGMSFGDAIALIEARASFFATLVDFTETYDVFPLDGANALAEVLTDVYGWAPAVSTPSFWGPQPPKMERIEISYGVFKEVPWGRFSIPGTGTDGFIQTGYTRNNDGRIVFQIQAHVYRKDEAKVRQLCEGVREYLKENSIYRGQAIKVRFRDDDNNPLPMARPEFLNLAGIKREGLIYSDAVMEQIDINLFTPITEIHGMIADGEPIKRGVLLGGPFGTGKTLAANVAAKLATENGITYLYVPRAAELSDAIEFAKQYQSPGCILFAEDIDRATSGERSVKIDDILNLIDGIDTKRQHIITVLTTNNMDAINPAMLRPGRLDAVIEVSAPDAVAVEKLIRYYGKGRIKPEASLEEAGAILAGQIPATIAEVVQRATLAARKLDPGKPVKELTGEALAASARSMDFQVKLLARLTAVPTPEPKLDTLLNGLVADRVKDAIRSVEQTVDEIRERV